MKTTFKTLATALALSALLAPIAIERSVAAGMSTQDWYIRIESMRKAGADHPWVAATIRAIDKRTGRLTIEHGAIPQVKMPAMSMTFPVRDAADLTAHAVGDRVNVQVGKDGGAIKIVHVKRAGS